MVEPVLLTKEGLLELQKEYEHLVGVKRHEVASRIKEAISYGDISENAEYDSAKNEQAELEERILELENMLRFAEVIEEQEGDVDCVQVGLKVKIKNMKTKEIESFTIVGSTEADPLEGKMSNVSPVGSALLKKKVGEVVTVDIPDGHIDYKVMEIINKGK